MEKIMADDPIAQSADVVSDNLTKLAELFPEAMVEGKIDFEVLKQLLGGAVDERDERYGLNWHGKRRARQLALTPSLGTLRPCPEESIDWETTRNLMIDGDNLEVLKLLQKSYSGKVDLIYIDPPYNTGRDFVYPDDFRDGVQNYLSLTGQVEGEQKVTSNSETSGRFHANWLSMIMPRLRVAHRLLSRSGLLCVSIGDAEVARLRLLLDEIFGEENFVATIAWQKKQSPQNDAINMSDMHDNIVVYARQAKTCRGDADGFSIVKVAREEGQESRYDNKDNDERGPWTSGDMTCNKTAEERPNLYFPIKNPHTNEDVYPKKTRVWGYEKAVVKRLLEENRIWWGEKGTNVPRIKIFRDEVDDGVVPSTWWTREFAGDNQEGRREIRELFPERDVFDTPKPTRLLRRIIEISIPKDRDSIAMDFFAGSGTFGESCFLSNIESERRVRFILVQLPEPSGKSDFPTLADVTKERLRRAAKRCRTEGQTEADLGFRVFKLDSSNIETWDPRRDDLDASLIDHIDHVKDDRTDDDVLYELLLKLGLDLCVPIEQQVIAETVVHSIGAGTLFTCLARKIAAEMVEPLAHGIVEWHKQLAPTGESTVVFRDSAFIDDVVKTNLSAILHQYGLTNVRSL